MQENIVVLGMDYGDEAKGRVADLLAENRDIVVRFSGGANAGHTLIIGDKKIVLRLIPCGAVRENILCVLGQGMVIDLAVLYEEVLRLEKFGVKIKDRLLISKDAHILMPYHIMVDAAREKNSNRPLDTTKKGIGPAYEDKVRRTGLKIYNMFLAPDDLINLIKQSLQAWAPLFKQYNINEISAVDVYDKLKPYIDFFKDNIDDTKFLNHTNASILFEGAQGFMLDIDNGGYPYVTSSSCSIGGVLTGSGVSHKKIGKVVGVCKAYSTRVGNGYFRTEIFGDLADEIRRVGGEFGAVTGRPRRVGWLNLDVINRAIDINGIDEVALSKIDVLENLTEIKVLLDDRYHIFSGPLGNVRVSHFDDLLPNAKEFISFIEKNIKCELGIISFGPERSEYFCLSDILK